MTNDYNRMNHSRFNNYSQHASAQSPGQFYNQGGFQQQPQTSTPPGYYPAFQTSRPQESSTNFGLSAFGFQGWNQSNTAYGKHQDHSSDTIAWRSAAEANAGLSSLAFASGLAQASSSFDQLRAQSNIMQSQHYSPSIGNNRIAQTQAMRPSATPQSGRQSQASTSTASGPQIHQRQGSNQSSVRRSALQASSNTPSVNDRPTHVNKTAPNTTVSSNSMFVNPSQVYNPPPSYRPVSLHSVEYNSERSDVPETNLPRGNAGRVNIVEETVAPPKEKKKRQRRATEDNGENKNKRKARKTGSSTAPSEKLQTKDAGTANSNTSSGAKESEPLEAQMRSMFLRMREFNEMNPELLAKLWQEERENHIAKTSTVENQTENASPNAQAHATDDAAAANSKKGTPKSGAGRSKGKETPSKVKNPTTSKKKTKKADSQATSAQSVRVDTPSVADDPSQAMAIQSPKGSVSKERSGNKSNSAQIGDQTPTPIATKEDRAYKKTFADLVDLTVDSSDDDGPMFSVRSLEHVPEMTAPPPNGDVVPEPRINSQYNEAPQTYARSLPLQPVPRLRPRPPPETTLAEPLDRYKAIRRSAYNPKTIARDVLIACGRHPDMRRLNEHLTLLKDGFPGRVDLSSDLSTLRWDIIDPGGPPPGSASVQAATADDDADDESVDEPPLYETLPRVTRQAESRPLRLVHSDAPSLPEPNSSPANNSHTDNANKFKFVRMDSSTGSNRVLGKRGRPRGRPPASPSTRGAVQGIATGGQGYSALRAQQAQDATEPTNSETPRKRGRPVGWRKWMMKGASESARPGTGNAPEPYYHIYKCQWAGCSAELHNLDTLRKHLHKKHEQMPPSIECLWSDCGKAQPVSDPATGRVTTRWERQKFENSASWKFHVEKQHLSPIAWKFGDGPTGGILDPEASDASEAYNSDAKGRSVTPQINVPTEHAEKALQYEMDILAGGRIPKKTQEEKALDVQLAAESEKRAIGPGIDRGGAIFANEKRRMGFVDGDEDIEPDEDL